MEGPGRVQPDSAHRSFATNLGESQKRAKLTIMQTKVPSSELKLGMFVSSLDRPWLDTPFMFQGFLIQEEEDIRLLQRYCEFVQVDWSRSPLPQPSGGFIRKDQSVTETGVDNQSPGSAAPTSAAETKPAPDGKNDDGPAQSEGSDTLASMPLPTASERRPAKKSAPDDSQPDQPDVPDNSDQQGFLSGLAERLMGFFQSRPKVPQASARFKQQPPASEDNAGKNERPVFIPGNIELAAYVDVRPVEEEIAPAVKAHDHANDVLDNLVKDIRSNRRFAFEETEIVAQEVVGSMVRNPDAMMWITRLRKQDEVVYGHGLQVAVNLVALGRHLGLPKDMLDRLCMIGLLLDIGKIKLPKELLLKKGRLTPEEFETVKSHVQLALDILKETPNLHPDVLQGIAQHHERENGSGYPGGLSKSEISLFGRMAAIVDSFSALTNPRPYAETMPAYEALQCLGNFNPNLFQASMLEQLVQAIGVFPVGSMVELSSGEVAVVISHSKVRRLKPRVLIISDLNKQPLSQPTTLDLLYQPQIAEKNELYIFRGLPAGAFGLDAREFFLM